MPYALFLVGGGENPVPADAVMGGEPDEQRLAHDVVFGYKAPES